MEYFDSNKTQIFAGDRIQLDDMAEPIVVVALHGNLLGYKKENDFVCFEAKIEKNAYGIAFMVKGHIANANVGVSPFLV